MANQVFNIAKGRSVELYNNIASGALANSALIIVLLQVSEADDVLTDYDTLGALLAAAGNNEADFTNYTRVVFTDAELTTTSPDDVNNRVDLDMPDPSWVAAGGTVDNTLSKLLVCYDSDTTAGDDNQIVPLAHFDFVGSTTGQELTAQVSTSGFLRVT